MKVRIVNGATEIEGHQPNEILCAGVSGIVSAYMVMYPNYANIVNGESRAEDLVYLLDNGKDSYQMVINALKSLDPNEYDIEIMEEM